MSTTTLLDVLPPPQVQALEPEAMPAPPVEPPRFSGKKCASVADANAAAGGGCCSSGDQCGCALASTADAQDVTKRHQESDYATGHACVSFCDRTSCAGTELAVRKPRAKRKPSEAAARRRMANQIPDDIQNDPELTKAITQVHERCIREVEAVSATDDDGEFNLTSL